MEHPGHPLAERAARYRARLRTAHTANVPVLPNGRSRIGRMEAMDNLQRIPLAQALATFGVDWGTCLDTSATLAEHTPVVLTLPNVDDGPLAIVILAAVGAQLTFENGT